MDVAEDVELNTPVIDIFDNDSLNVIGAVIVNNLKDSKRQIKKARDAYGQALVRRWENGKLVYKNLDAIKEECGSQRIFAEKLGITENMLSNDKRAFVALEKEGCETADDVLKLLDRLQISRTTQNWERLPALIANDGNYNDPDTRHRDERRLEQMSEEMGDIVERHQSGNRNHLAEIAKEELKEIEEVKNHLKKLDPLRSGWRSEDYKRWARSIGRDAITGEPAQVLEFHHTDILGGSGSVGTKLPDVFGIPVTPETHRKIEEGSMKVTSTQLAAALCNTMALFIVTHYESD